MLFAQICIKFHRTDLLQQNFDQFSKIIGNNLLKTNKDQLLMAIKVAELEKSPGSNLDRTLAVKMKNLFRM